MSAAMFSDMGQSLVEIGYGFDAAKIIFQPGAPSFAAIAKGGVSCHSPRSAAAGRCFC
jgi:hypothetical protein